MQRRSAHLAITTACDAVRLGECGRVGRIEGLNGMFAGSRRLTGIMLIVLTLLEQSDSVRVLGNKRPAVPIVIRLTIANSLFDSLQG